MRVKRNRHLIIADTQCKPNHNLEYMRDIGRYIVDQRPNVIVDIGDHFDFESLSSYDKGKRAAEGRRLSEDLRAGYEGMDLLLGPLRALQAQQRANKKAVYKPRMIFCLGNHEDRADRMANEQPELAGFVGTDQLALREYGWEVYPFLRPAVVDGIHYVHYLANPMTGRPYGGNALNQLKTVGCSFVVGHKQTLDCAVRPTLDGRMQIGIINGAAYPHDEAYKGPQGNTHFRGITVLNEVKDGFGCPMFVTLDYLKARYRG